LAKLSEIDKRYFIMAIGYADIGNIGESDISATCPVCNEGKSRGRKHRFHLYIKETYDNASLACFNCDYSANMFSFLKDHSPAEYVLYKNEVRGQNFTELKMKNLSTNKESSIDDFDIESGLDFSSSDIIENNIIKDNEQDMPTTKKDINSISTGLDFSCNTIEKTIIKDTSEKPILIEPVKGFIKLPEEAIEYIRSRGIEQKDNWLYSPLKNKILFNGVKQELSEYIIIPLTIDNKWYGFQALAWKQKKFFVYMVTGNSGWKVWNWDNINKDEPVYIFESIYDAISSGLDNVIAQLGANLGEERLKQLKQPIFCLDNFRVDDKAREELLKYSELGYKVFIWPEGSEAFKDTNDLRKIKVPYEKIADMINKNIYSGIRAQIRLKLK